VHQFRSETPAFYDADGNTSLTYGDVARMLDAAFFAGDLSEAGY
jgi:hypothetical protein